MAQNQSCFGSCRVVLFFFFVAALLSFLPVQSDAEDAAKARCDYILNVDESPLSRANFITTRNKMYELMLHQADPDVRYRPKGWNPPNQPSRQIDEMSQACLGCHDEMGAVKKYGSNIPPRFNNSGMALIAEAHPVGLLYEKRTIFRDNLNSSAEFPPDVVLVNGRISCITCHDPLNPVGNHMASGKRSSLCFICHKM